MFGRRGRADDCRAEKCPLLTRVTSPAHHHHHHHHNHRHIIIVIIIIIMESVDGVTVEDWQHATSPRHVSPFSHHHCWPPPPPHHHHTHHHHRSLLKCSFHHCHSNNVIVSGPTTAIPIMMVLANLKQGFTTGAPPCLPQSQSHWIAACSLCREQQQAGNCERDCLSDCCWCYKPYLWMKILR